MMKMYEVGGCVRDEFLGIESKDIDFAVEAESFDSMFNNLVDQGFQIFLSTPEFLTIRARFPKGHKNERLTADFVLCRKDSAGSDGRRPDFVVPGTLMDDLARRDFTVNAMAKADDGRIIDPFGGRDDLALGKLRFVGTASERLREDALRALRAIRFRVTKSLRWTESTFTALVTMDPATLAAVSVERRREELLKAFQHDTSLTCKILFQEMSPEFTSAVFEGGLWLMPTLRK